MKRALAAASFSFAAAVLAGQYAFSGGQLLYAAAACAIPAAACFFIRLPEAARFLKAALPFFAAGFLYLYGYHAFFLMPAEAMDGRTETLSAVVLEYPEPAAYGMRATVRADIPGDGFHRAVKAVLYLDEDAPALYPGDRISVKAALAAAGVSNEDLSRLQSRGIFLRASQKGALELDRPARMPAWAWPAAAAQALREQVGRVFPGEDAAFVQALLLGDTSGLSQSFSGALAAAGLSHVVAVSGMHVAFLAGMVLLLVRKKRLATGIAIPVILAFMAVTGFPPSVVRAGVMQILALSAFLLGREADAVTSMGAALFCLLLINPYAASGASLQLSFCATLGILLFARRIYTDLSERIAEKTRKAPGRAAGFLMVTLASTLSALLFTVPLAAHYFGTVSLVAPLSNLLAIWAVSVAFCAGLAAALISFVWLPAGVALGYAARPFIRYVALVAKGASRLPFASANVQNPYFLGWLVYIYLAAVLYFISALLGRKSAAHPPERAGKPRRLVLPVCISICTLCLAMLLSAFRTANTDLSAAVLDVGQGQCVVVTSDAWTAVVDCGGSKKAGTIAAGYLRGLGRTQVDLLMLTHFHADHANGVSALFDSVNVKAVAYPELPEEGGLYEEIVSRAGGLGIKRLGISRDTSLAMGKMKIGLFAPEPDAPGVNERGMSVLCALDGFELLITGDLSGDSERKLAERLDLPDIEAIVVGHHGSKYSSSEELLEETRPDVAVVSVGKNHYGHPSAEALDRLREAGARIYRTDENGTVEIDVRDAA